MPVLNGCQDCSGTCPNKGGGIRSRFCINAIDDLYFVLQHLRKTKAAIRDRDIQLALTDELVKAEMLKNRRRMADTLVCYMRAEDDRDDPSKSQPIPPACNLLSFHRAHKTGSHTARLVLGILTESILYTSHVCAYIDAWRSDPIQLKRLRKKAERGDPLTPIEKTQHDDERFDRTHATGGSSELKETASFALLMVRIRKHLAQHCCRGAALAMCTPLVQGKSRNTLLWLHCHKPISNSSTQGLANAKRRYIVSETHGADSEQLQAALLRIDAGKTMSPAERGDLVWYGQVRARDIRMVAAESMFVKPRIYCRTDAGGGW